MILNTDRLILRPLTDEDAEDLYEYLSDFSTVQYMSFDCYEKVQKVREWMETVKAMWNQTPQRAWDFVIQLKTTKKVIGAIGIFIRNRKLTDGKEAEIGWIMNKKYWGNGYISEAANEVLRLGFETFNFHRIVAFADTKNAASFSVMEKLGMRREGEFIKDHLFKDGTYHDYYFYAILEEEYRYIKSRAPLNFSTQRLTLREFKPSDYNDICAYAFTPQLYKYMLHPSDTPDSVKAFIHRAVCSALALCRKIYVFAIEYKGRVIGHCELKILKGSDEAVIGWLVAPDYQGKGIGFEAASAVMGFGFGCLNVRRICAYCDVQNIPSKLLMEKLGMRLEGKEVSARAYPDGRLADELSYALLRSEYNEKTVKNKE